MSRSARLAAISVSASIWRRIFRAYPVYRRLPFWVRSNMLRQVCKYQMLEYAGQNAEICITIYDMHTQDSTRVYFPKWSVLTTYSSSSPSRDAALPLDDGLLPFPLSCGAWSPLRTGAPSVVWTCAGTSPLRRRASRASPIVAPALALALALMSPSWVCSWGCCFFLSTDSKLWRMRSKCSSSLALFSVSILCG